MPSYDAILIGAGTNGLACAKRLAMAGKRILVLEEKDAPGGGARSHEFAPGFKSPGLAHLVHVLDPRVMKAMDLGQHGLSFAHANLPSTALSKTGDHLRLEGAFGTQLKGNIAEVERASWNALRAQLLSFAKVLSPFKAITPPRLALAPNQDYLKLAKLLLGVRLLGKAKFRELLRMLLINVWDVLSDELQDERLKALLGFDATLGSWLGPRSPNSLLLLLNRLSGESLGQTAALALPHGGMGSVASAMVKSVLASGVDLRCASKVQSLIIEDDKAVGVRLATGEELRAPLIISAINPKTTFLHLVGPRHLDTDFVNRMRQQKSRGAAAKLHLGLKAAPDFKGADLKSRLVIAESLNAMEQAFNAVKYGEVPDNPVMEIILPSLYEEGFAPQGQHVLSAIVQFAPHEPKAGKDAARATMLENILRQLEAHAPGLRGLILHAELLMPYDIEEKYGLVGGNWHHGELSVEQMLFLRPLAGMARYSTPLSGLWLAGAGTHPGGGISGASGWNAAERILKEVTE